MTASGGTRTTPPRCHESPFSSRSFVGILVATLVLLLPTSSDGCGAPPRFSSMMLSGAPQSSYSPGDRIEFKCRPGYQLIVPPLVTTAICQPDNTWSALQEACKRKSCPQLGDPSNGQVVYVNGTDFGSQAQFVCDEGFHLLGTATLYCEISGNTVDWSGVPPQCEKSLCQPPKQIPNGRYTNSHKDTFEYNEVVTYSCDPSSGPDPYSLVGESKLICSGQNVWSSDPPECKVVKCPYPALKNGHLVSGFGTKYYYKAMVVFECLPGFYLKGNNTVVCGANSIWEPEFPECLEVSIPPSTTHPILSHPVSTPPSTIPPFSSVSGVTPIKPTTPPVSSHPGQPSKPPSTDLGPGIIALIVIASLAGAAACVSFVYVILKRKKKRERQGSAAYSTYQNKSSTPTE